MHVSEEFLYLLPFYLFYLVLTIIGAVLLVQKIRKTFRKVDLLVAEAAVEIGRERIFTEADRVLDEAMAEIERSELEKLAVLWATEEDAAKHPRRSEPGE